MSTPPTSQQVARSGVHFVAAELHWRGANAEVSPPGRSQNEIVATDVKRSREVVVYVKTKRVGDWHTDASKGRREGTVSADGRFWVFVDLEPANAPAFYVAPAAWVEDNIYREHQAFLARHGGHRPRTPTSTHHGIKIERIAQWRDRWDLLQLF